ncbi:hypothetical protein N9D23_01015 [Rubripirellula sp.]|nr:hypothetical protein [Rubripirellula sp.]
MMTLPVVEGHSGALSQHCIIASQRVHHSESVTVKATVIDADRPPARLPAIDIRSSPQRSPERFY